MIRERKKKNKQRDRQLHGQKEPRRDSDLTERWRHGER